MDSIFHGQRINTFSIVVLSIIWLDLIALNGEYVYIATLVSYGQLRVISFYIFTTWPDHLQRAGTQPL